MSDRLTPERGRLRFGELRDPKLWVLMHFEDEETGGTWRPEMVGRDPSPTGFIRQGEGARRGGREGEVFGKAFELLSAL